MISIDDSFLEGREFCGTIQFCFNKGKLQHIKAEETVTAEDPDHKLLCYGIKIDQKQVSCAGAFPVTSPAPPQGGVGQG